MNSNDSDGIVYILQPKEYIGTNIYKIGCSRRNIKRVDEYKKGKRVIVILNTTKPFKLESMIKKIFKEKFKLVKGSEYFSGDENLIKKQFFEIIESVENDNDDISNNNDDSLNNDIFTHDISISDDMSDCETSMSDISKSMSLNSERTDDNTLVNNLSINNIDIYVNSEIVTKNNKTAGRPKHNYTKEEIDILKIEYYCPSCKISFFKEKLKKGLMSQMFRKHINSKRHKINVLSQNKTINNLSNNNEILNNIQTKLDKYNNNNENNYNKLQNDVKCIKNYIQLVNDNEKITENYNETKNNETNSNITNDSIKSILNKNDKQIKDENSNQKLILKQKVLLLSKKIDNDEIMEICSKLINNMIDSDANDKKIILDLLYQQTKLLRNYKKNMENNLLEIDDLDKIYDNLLETNDELYTYYYKN